MKQNLFFNCIYIIGLFIPFHIVGDMNIYIIPPNVAINRVILQTVEDVDHLNLGYDLYLAGVGGSIDHDTGKEKMIGITFHLDHSLSKEKCRCLIVAVAQKFLENINSNSDLTQFLPNGHFSFKNIEVSIALLSPVGSFLYHPEIGYVFLTEGEISYAYNDPLYIGTQGPYKEVIKEPIEEALKIVETQGRPDKVKGVAKV